MYPSDLESKLFLLGGAAFPILTLYAQEMAVASKPSCLGALLKLLPKKLSALTRRFGVVRINH